jgi:hypothetical protein
MKDEIKALLEELGDFEARMTREELFDFQMLRKRMQDGEEFDRLSSRRAEELHKKYVVRKIVKDIDSLLKKYSKQVKDFGAGKDNEPPGGSGRQTE